MKKSSFFLLAAFIFIMGCTSRRQQQYIQTPQTVTGQTKQPVGLEFIADIPSLKGVSLKMSESKFLDILHKQNLDFTQEKIADETTYYVEPQAHVLIIFVFQRGHCAAAQRLTN
jgi:hypothetical protein